ncbi:MAG: hypothetical protein ABEK59_01425 [Halobacteria archaeon]
MTNDKYGEDVDMVICEAIPAAETDKVGLPRDAMQALGIKPGHPIKIEDGLGEYIILKPREDAKWDCPLCGYTNSGHRRRCKECDCLDPREEEDGDGE